MKRRISVVAAGVVVLLMLTSQALAGAVIDTAASHLRNDPVYVDPGATTVLSADAASRVRAHITSGQAGIFVAALPADVTSETNGNADQLPAALGRAIGRNGAVGVLTSRVFRAGASSGAGLQTGQAGELANLAFAAHKAQGPEAVVQDWISRVQSAVAQNRAQGARGAAQARALKPKKSHTGLVIFLILLALLLIGVFIWLVVHFAKRNNVFRAEKSKTSSQVEHLGGQVMQYADVTNEDIATASERHRWASSELDKAHTVDDLDAINIAVEEGFTAIRRYQHRDDPKAPKRDRGRKLDDSDYIHADRVKAGQRTNVKAPSNTTVVNNYGGSGQPGYWYGGGMYGGMYYGPGYYSSMNFWEGMMLGEMLSDRGDRDYDRDDDRSSGGGGGDRDSSSDVGGGDWDSGGGSDSGSGSSVGGGDFTPDPEPSYSPPSYDPPSYDPPDSGGGDFGGGGGFDSGGGGFDSGGGGFDSGGGGGDF